MRTLTIRIPEDKHDRLKRLAEARGISINKLVDEMATQALVEQDVYNRFLARVRSGSATRGLTLLDKATGKESNRE